MNRDALKGPLYQVHVTDTEAGHEIPVGYATNVEDALTPLVERINMAVVKGELHGWRDAHVKRVR